MDQVYDEVKREFTARGAYILKDNEIDKMRNTLVINDALNTAIVGQSACKIAKMAGIDVSNTTNVIIGEVQSVEHDEPFSREKLSPVLAMYRASSFEDALTKAIRLIELGGFGHTSVLYTDTIKSRDRIRQFETVMKTGRTLINMPAAHGAIGDIFNFKLAPSLTLGCGTWGGNSVSDNVGVRNLLNIKTVAERRENMLWFRVPQKIYYK
jgi:acetaldehyde dehydrogenase/alcohol dehydrogenase